MVLFFTIILFLYLTSKISKIENLQKKLRDIENKIDE